MNKSAKIVSVKNFIILCIVTILILFFTSVNIKIYLSPRKVLGVETNNETTEMEFTQKFWQEFLNKNPDYIPGWIEIGRKDKVKEIDPNYIIP